MEPPTASFADTAKSLGTMLATVSGLAYACGYLVRRARAHALGLDPGFTLVDETYVFAGFRFALLTLLALLVAAPLLFAVRAVARGLSRSLRPGARAVAERLTKQQRHSGRQRDLWHEHQHAASG